MLVDQPMGEDFKKLQLEIQGANMDQHITQTPRCTRKNLTNTSDPG